MSSTIVSIVSIVNRRVKVSARSDENIEVTKLRSRQRKEYQLDQIDVVKPSEEEEEEESEEEEVKEKLWGKL